MPTKNHFFVIESATLSWPPAFHIPSRRFRLFVAADVSGVTTDVIPSSFMPPWNVAWCISARGDLIVRGFTTLWTKLVVEDDLGERQFRGPNRSDTIMTTWHESDTLEETTDFFMNFAFPTDGFEADSNSWIALCVNNLEWATSIRRKIEAAELHE
jgi:hypothetical protein